MNSNPIPHPGRSRPISPVHDKMPKVARDRSAGRLIGSMRDNLSCFARRRTMSFLRRRRDISSGGPGRPAGAKGRRAQRLHRREARTLENKLAGRSIRDRCLDAPRMGLDAYLDTPRRTDAGPALVVARAPDPPSFRSSRRRIAGHLESLSSRPVPSAFALDVGEWSDRGPHGVSVHIAGPEFDWVLVRVSVRASCACLLGDREDETWRNPGEARAHARA